MNVSSCVAGHALGIGGPVAPLELFRNRRAVVILHQLQFLILVVDDLEKEHPAELGDALGVAIDADVLAHDVLNGFDGVAYGHGFYSSELSMVLLILKESRKKFVIVSGRVKRLIAHLRKGIIFPKQIRVKAEFSNETPTKIYLVVRVIGLLVIVRQFWIFSQQVTFLDMGAKC